MVPTAGSLIVPHRHGAKLRIHEDYDNCGLRITSTMLGNQYGIRCPYMGDDGKGNEEV